MGFKPYYKWITFNIANAPPRLCPVKYNVLNLIING